jgi:hypothetical protein
MMKHKILVGLMLIGLMTITGNAHAYIDPGSGSLMLQALIGVLAAGLIALKAYWHQVKHFFSRSKRSRLEEAESSDIDSTHD